MRHDLNVALLYVRVSRLDEDERAAKRREMYSARMAFALRHLEGLTVERSEDSVPPPVVALFR